MIFLYLFLVLLIGIYTTSGKSEIDFIYASRKLTLPSFIATFVTTWYGGILEIGRFSFENGLVTWIIFGLFYYLSAFIFVKYVGKRIYKNQIDTIPGYFHKYYGYTCGLISSMIIILISSPALYLMIFSVILGWIMTRVILSIVFYLIITPIGLITRLLGEDFLELKKSKVDSYWNQRDRNIEINQDYEKQF